MFCKVDIDERNYAESQGIDSLRTIHIEKTVEDATSDYYYLDSHNLIHALSEADTPVYAIKGEMLYRCQLAQLLIDKKYAEFGKLAESISREYWINIVDEMTE